MTASTKIPKECSFAAQNGLTLRYMTKYGISNVRGGIYCQIILSNQQIQDIQTKIKSVENKCFICDSTEHFAKECPRSIKKAAANYFVKRGVRFVQQNYKPKKVAISSVP